ncbi:MAG: hypothetical protein F4171_18185 [Gammaproteobacteria bacterium]|nr:hypothetical protein [Gammaproteobacteria bacterium]MYK27293.1 hypothetical protein [Gammaproteobacteria bacterium]
MPREPIVGGDLLRLITAGMYDDPLVIFREYLQNAADASASTGRDSGTVQINVDPVEASVTITDDGPGLTRADAVNRLIPIGNSLKNPSVDRGLRGIGRLASLAFADEVHFATRTDGAHPVTSVCWSGRNLRDPGLRGLDAATTIEKCTSVHSLPEGDWPDQFFQVTVKRIARHAAPTLLNRDAVRRYIAEVCPVPISPTFPLINEVKDFLAEHTDNFALDVRLDGDESSILRPFSNALPLSDTYAAPFERLETRVIPRLDDGEPAAVLWLAHTPYAGSIPRHLGVRGLRARAGNIQVGSEAVFGNLFHESRFNGWCVGEVHITDSRIVPNGRRDYFEPGPHLRNLENHIGAIAHEVSARCRRASSHRNRLRQAENSLRQTESAKALAHSGYLLPEDATALLDRSRQQVSRVEDTLAELQITSPSADQDGSDLLGEPVDPPLPERFDGLSSELIHALKSAFGALAISLPSESAFDLIQSILGRVSSQRCAIDPEHSPQAKAPESD